MIVEIYKMLATAFGYVSFWFSEIVLVTGTKDILLGSIMIFMVIRIFVAPLTGAAMRIGYSDMVRKGMQNSRTQPKKGDGK